MKLAPVGYSQPTQVTLDFMIGVTGLYDWGKGCIIPLIVYGQGSLGGSLA
ncbi:hypothetical protein OOK60_01025 [Trichothermofontia sichuanensis B231]|nr:hypothetical protein [Trichothermofontia sichuanensis]UZQ54694.1 hypothetical protein OOK60_01025 [Trichothermofontia sichuanensis B231]